MKERLLIELKEHRHAFISGEALSQALGVSRTAVWKHINELKLEGYRIESSSKKGYKLVDSCDILNEHEIKAGLDTSFIGREVVFFESGDSTNNYAKKIAQEGCENGTLVVAEQQTAGRGRLGRNWDSAGKKGIWMSVVLKPDILPEEVQIITIAASVAVVKAIKESTGVGCGIKWPNDIVIEGKKVCGILTEMSSEPGKINFVVLGIGINVNHHLEDFPPEIHNCAISLSMLLSGAQKTQDAKKEYSRSAIVKSVLKELETVYNIIKDGKTECIIEEWKKYSVTLGKEVRITYKGEEIIGTAFDLENDGRLLVRCSDGRTLDILSGEIMVRGLLGYI